MKSVNAMFVHQFNLLESQDLCREYYDEYSQYMVDNDRINDELSNSKISESMAHTLFTEKFLNKFSIPKKILEEYDVSLKAVLFFNDDFKTLLMQTCMIDSTKLYNAVVPNGISVKFKIYAEDAVRYQTFLNNMKIRGVYIEEFDGYVDITDMMKKEINI